MSSDDRRHNFHSVSPLDPEPPESAHQPSNSSKDHKNKVTIVNIRPRTASSSSSGLNLASPRTPRFAEATSVNSPIDGAANGANPFRTPPPPSNTRFLMAQPQVSDVGFGYVADNAPSKHTSFAEVPMTPASPLKSALRVPGTPGRLNPLSPTFREEEALEKREEHTEKQNAADLKVKTRVRIAKMCLRFTNFGCSLIVLSMLSTTLTIFNATRGLPKRSNLPAWAPAQKTWPQITLLTIACVSLAMTIIVFYAYWRGGHRRAEKAAVYYTLFSLAFFTFDIIMWIIGAVVLNQSRRNGKGQDMWGWSCKDGKRKDVFQQDVDYALICRLQNWSLICALIEILVGVITISIYSIIYWRFASKRRLHKSMDVRDKARSDLYLAQLRTQSAPNTPGFQKTPMTATFPHHLHDDSDDDVEKTGDVQYASPQQHNPQPKPFTLQPPPIKVHAATPDVPQDGFEAAPKVQEHVPAAPGEQTYEAVPIPGAYAAPLASPTPAAQPMNFSRPGAISPTASHR